MILRGSSGGWSDGDDPLYSVGGLQSQGVRKRGQAQGQPTGINDRGFTDTVWIGGGVRDWTSTGPGPSAMARNTQNCRRSERERNLGGRSGRFLSYLYGQPLELGFLVCGDGAA